MSKTVEDVLRDNMQVTYVEGYGDMACADSIEDLAEALEAAGFGRACQLPHETVRQRQNREKLQMQMRQIREVLELKITDAPDDLKWAVSRIEKIIAWGEDEL